MGQSSGPGNEEEEEEWCGPKQEKESGPGSEEDQADHSRKDEVALGRDSHCPTAHVGLDLDVAAREQRQGTHVAHVLGGAAREDHLLVLEFACRGQIGGLPR